MFVSSTAASNVENVQNVGAAKVNVSLSYKNVLHHIRFIDLHAVTQKILGHLLATFSFSASNH